MKQLQNGIYTFNIGEKNWGEEANQNFETLDNLIENVTDNNAKFKSLSEKIQTNANNITQTKEDLTDNIINIKSELQSQVDVLNSQLLALQYKINNLGNIDNALHANEADTATLAYTANIAKKLENSLTIGSTNFDGSTPVSIGVDNSAIENSTNLINSNAVYNVLKQIKDPLSDEQVNEIIKDYLDRNPIEAGLDETAVNKLIAKYLSTWQVPQQSLSNYYTIPEVDALLEDLVLNGKYTGEIIARSKVDLEDVNLNISNNIIESDDGYIGGFSIVGTLGIPDNDDISTTNTTE